MTGEEALKGLIKERDLEKANRDIWDEEEERIRSDRYVEMLNIAIKALEPKIGHWVDGEYCSECGCDVPAYMIDWKWQKDMDAKYCPQCGAKMEEEE